MSDTKHTPGFQRWSPAHRDVGMWTHGEGSYYKASEVDAELAKVMAERDELAYVLPNLYRALIAQGCKLDAQMPLDERISICKKAVELIDRIKAGQP